MAEAPVTTRRPRHNSLPEDVSIEDVIEKLWPLFRNDPGDVIEKLWPFFRKHPEDLILKLWPLSVNETSEKTVLGAMIWDASTVEEVLGIIREDAFTTPMRRVIFSTIASLHHRGEHIDAVSVESELTSKGETNAAHLLGELETYPVDAPFHARQVRKAQECRRLHEALTRGLDRLQEGPESVVQCLRPELEKSPDGVRPIECIDLHGELEPIPWLIEGWLAKQDVAMLAGAAESGKSTLAFDLADALTRGRPWLGIAPTQALKVLIVDQEQGARAAQRLSQRIAKPYGKPHENLRIASGQGLSLTDPEALARLEQFIKSESFDLVIFDSVQQLFGGVDENSSSEVGPVFGELFRLRDKYGLTVLLIHHWRKVGQAPPQNRLELLRGTTAFGTQCSTVWEYVRNGNASADLKPRKRREDDPPPGIRVGRTAEGKDGPLVLTRLGTIEETETETGRGFAWIGQFLAGRDSARAGEIVSAGKLEGFTQPTIERIMREACSAGLLSKPRRGVYSMASRESDAPCGKLDGNLMETQSFDFAPDGHKSSGRDHLGAPRALGPVDGNLMEG